MDAILANSAPQSKPCTGREAVRLLLHGQAAPFVPLHDSPWTDTLRAWTEQGMPTDDEGNALSATEHFDFDMQSIGGWFAWEARIGASEILEETDAWKIVRNGNGAALKWWKHRSGTPEHIDFRMNCRAVWERDYRPHLLGDVRGRVGDTAALRRRREHAQSAGRWTFFGNLFVWEILRASLGDVGMLTALLDDPDWIRDMCRVYTDLYKRCFTILFEEAGLPDGIWIYEDLGYRDRLFCSPDLLADLFFPFYAELVDFLHGYGLPVVLHSCGYQAPMIPLAVEAGFDGLNPMEAKAGNDLFAYAETFGEQLCFIGGLDARVLESGDRERIRDEVTRLVTGMRERGARYVFGSDHSLSTEIRYEDFCHALEVYRAIR